MLKAKYPLQAPHPKALSFSAGDRFLPLHSPNKEKEWWLVLSKDAEVGYIPMNYVLYLPATTADITGFLQRGSDRLASSSLSDDQQAVQRRRLAQLAQRYRARDTAGDQLYRLEEPAARPVSSLSLFPDDESSTTEHVQTNGDDREATPVPEPEREPEPERPLPAAFGRSLVDLVRQHTSASHQACQATVQALMGALKQAAPSVQPVADQVLSQLSSADRDAAELLSSPDGRRLRVILEEMTSCADDQQQRSWQLHCDEPAIIEYLQELSTILTNADPCVSRRALESDQMSGVLALARLYQMEPRWLIRQPLTQALGLACGLHRDCISLLLSSVLPSELARDMQSSVTDDIRLSHSALLLSMILCMGEKLPHCHMEMLGAGFVSFLLETLERPPPEVSDDTADLLLTVLLALNLQYGSPTENQLLAALRQRDCARVFTEKVMLLFNREEDPVRVFDHEPAPAHSVVKLMVDLFSEPASTRLFYTNDVRVLVDIVVRNLADLSPGDPRRHEYLRLCGRLLASEGYSEYGHRCADILICLRRIATEGEMDGDETQPRDRQLATTTLALHGEMLEAL
ncbi:NCK-interacting protein with SH3 domain-like isoform X1 [Amphibalanus amphitrite]|uniref:NCK-interacting protein with SH3 domain-like isoform X1 n=1 Tax=Amphibalanus amphitrite TaxID=1232801 RepID=UPI001C901F6C|nr:NCK-interacting protein with SH3 domain-like isoform X1 [Amphibalanus amphitrite]